MLVVPDKSSFIRSLINFMFFQGFLLYIHYMRENAERKLYTLRDQLKVQFRATQKAQVNERKAADSKRRLTSYVAFTQRRTLTWISVADGVSPHSYVFHEVRVPLNTACECCAALFLWNYILSVLRFSTRCAEHAGIWGYNAGY